MKKAFLFLAVLMVFLSGAVLMAEPPVTGAVFTTDSTCSGVDLNIYTSKDQVYINGGPAHPGAAGLPDGSYCVQVTDPDGTVRGKSAPGAVSVVNGEFIACYQLSAIVNTASSGFTTPGYDDTANPGGEYKVWVSTDCDFTNSSTKTDNFKVKTPDPCVVDPTLPECQGHVPQAELLVQKFYDSNANGTWDVGEVEISGWKVCVQEASSINDCNHTTPVDMSVTPDTYTVSEGTPVESNWVHTSCADSLNGATATGCTFNSLPSTTADTFTVADGDVKANWFGNVCLGAGGGLTLGFWSNRNGQALITGTDITYLGGLCLRNASGTDFNPANPGALKTWLLSANATNMAYMLSAQLSAMELNVRRNFVSASALVYAPCLIGSGSNSLGFISIHDLMAAAETEICAHGSTLTGSPYRAYQECLKNALDNANNNLNFVQSAPCPFSF